MSYLIFASRHRWARALLSLLVAVLLGIAGGWAVATAGALITAAVLVGALAGVWVLRDVEAAYIAILAIICLLPFGALRPFLTWRWGPCLPCGWRASPPVSSAS
jgi:hypothetical protein